MVAPTLTAIPTDTDFEGWVIRVSITNKDSSKSFYVAKSDFHLLNGTNVVADQYDLSGSFPSFQKILPSDTIEGTMHFVSCRCHGPYTLAYDGPTGIIRTSIPIPDT
jgi:hypothetical protein